MLQDQRVIATSAVRCVGNTLILQGRVYSPPYTITAIGDVDRMRQALDSSPEIIIYKQYVDAYALGWKEEDLGQTTFPGFSGSVDLRYAKPMLAPMPAQRGGSPSISTSTSAGTERKVSP